MKQWGKAVIIAAAVVAVIAVALYATTGRPERNAASTTKDQEPLGVGSSNKKSGKASTEDRPSRKKEPSLPADYKPPYAAEPAIATLVDKRIPLNKRAPPDLVTKTSPAVIKRNLKALLFVLDDKTDHPSIRNNVLVLLRRSDYQPRLADHILRLLNDPAESDLFREYCVQHLMYAAQDEKDAKRRTWITSKIEGLGKDKNPKIRRAVLQALTTLDSPKALKVAEQVYRDEEQPSHIRQTAIHTLARFKANKHVPSLRQIARGHKDIELRIAAIAVLGQTFRDEESRPIFQAAAQDKHHFRLRSAGKVALRNLDRKPKDKR